MLTKGSEDLSFDAKATYSVYRTASTEYVVGQDLVIEIGNTSSTSSWRKGIFMQGGSREMAEAANQPPVCVYMLAVAF